MPAVGQPNNPGGANSFDHFAPEPAYGEATKNKELQQGAPMAGAKLASGPIQAAKRAGRQAQRGTPAPVAAPVAAMPAQVVSPAAQLAARWQAIASRPWADENVKAYALALQGPTNG